MGTPVGPRSSTWRVWAGGDGSVFVAQRRLTNELKVSLHASGDWRIEFIDRRTAHRIGAPGEDRAFDRFQPTPEVLPGVRHGVSVLIPWLALGLLPTGTRESGDIRWLPPLAEGRVCIIDLILTAPTVEVDDKAPGFLAGLRLRTGCGVVLRHATRAATPEEMTAWTKVQRIDDERVRAARETENADIKAFLVEVMSDGTRRIVDLRVPRHGSELTMTTLEPLRMKPAGPPATYFGVAENMMRGVKVLAATSPLPALALAIVAAHVLECLLKAYLSRGGSDAAVRKRDVQHDLVALWAMAVAQGLRVQKSPPDWVARLGALHKGPDFVLRYSTGVHGIVSPAAEPMTAELAALLETVRGQLG